MPWRFNMTFCFCLSTLHHGGAERVVVNICNVLCRRHNIYIILLSGTSTESIYSIDERIHVLSLEKEFGKSFRRFKKVFPLAKIFGIIKPNAVISFLPFVNVICHYACKKANIIHITSERNDPHFDPKNVVLRFLKERSMIKSRGLVCQTEEFKNYYLKKGARNVSVIPNPVFIDQCLKPTKAIERKRQIVFAGRLEPQKNVLLLLKAFKQVMNTHPDYFLVIFGDGSEKENLMQYAKEHNLKNVIFEGPSKKWHECVNNSRLFVICSDYEGMPNSLLEAMCLRVPCVSTLYSKIGPTFLIDNNVNGLICKKNDVDELAKCINELIESDKLCDSFSTKNMDLYKKYDVESISNSWESFILNTIRNR